MNPGTERLLVIDDDPGVVDLWTEVLHGAGFAVEGTCAPEDGLRRALAGAYDLVLCDVEMPGLRGPEILDRLLAARADQLVVLITAFGSIQSAVDSLRSGAADFVSKPCDPETLLHVVRRALRERSMRREIVRLRRRFTEEHAPSGLVAESAAMRRVLELADRVARANGPVLLQGESGTGKTALARWIHERSARRGGPFVAINSSALPEQLAEAELFGVKRGAFTDAVQDRPGLLRSADGGTVFLDEIAELLPSVQAKLLTVLETGRVRPVGGTQDVQVDIRLIAASNQPLAEAVERGTFRADLRYRLDVLTIAIPPLRERREDLAALVDWWLDRLARSHGRPMLGISAAGWRWLHAHPWHGNVRELINRLERAIVFSDHDFLGPEDFEDPVRTAHAATDPDALLLDLARRRMPLSEIEARYLRVALQVTDGNKSEAARLVGMDRRTLYRKLEERDE